MLWESGGKKTIVVVVDRKCGIKEGFMMEAEFELALEGEIDCGHAEMW